MVHLVAGCPDGHGQQVVRDRLLRDHRPIGRREKE